MILYYESRVSDLLLLFILFFSNDYNTKAEEIEEAAVVSVDR